MRKARLKWPLAIVMGASVNGLSFVRSLGRRGIPALLLDSERLVGTYSRYATSVLLPPPEQRPDEWMGLLEFLGARLPTPGVIFPTSDGAVLLVSKYQGVLERHFTFLVPTAETTAHIVDKKLQYAIAQSVGIPIPRTYFPGSLDEVRGISTKVQYPCLVKPYKSHEGRKKIGNRKVIVASTPESLVSVFDAVGAAEPSFMVQEVIPGEDNALYGYLAFWDSNHHEHAWLTKRKLRQYPPQFGDGSFQETTDCPEVAHLGRRLLQAIDYQGFVGVEFKRDARDGTYRLMEINARTVSGNQLCISAGVDFPGIGYQYLTGCDLGIEPARPFDRGVTYVHEAWDFRACLAIRGSGRVGLGSWVRTCRDADARALWSAHDPLPLLATVCGSPLALLRESRAMQLHRSKGGR